ncbi:MAG: aldehyde dehydrogenase family protein [Planctomycetes bacterium]|nr:aldehyde dehydrogenase family protein [Planctomycetota bacterium]
MPTLTIRSPSDGSLLGEVPVTPPEGIAERAGSSARAFEAWRRVPVGERAGLMRRLRAELVRSRRRIAELVAREQGKPVLEALVAEVFPSLDALTFLAHRGPRLVGDRKAPHFQPFLSHRRARYRFLPYGPWAVISPWNYPFAIPFIQAASLAFGGNTAVLKPSPLTPLTGDLVAELFRAAGFPEGVLEVVHGGAPEGEALIRDERIRGVLFTGSVANGRKVALAAAQGCLKKVVLELGGKDAAIVLSDAPLERAARGIAWAAMLNAGQTCASVERVYVEEPAAARFRDLLEESVGKIRVGSPLEVSTDMGPMTAPFQLEVVERHVEEARAAGARVATGGRRLRELGPLFYAPTVIHEAPAGARVLREETFGPVACVQAVRSAEEAARLANDAAYALTSSVWTRDPERARHLVPELASGVVTVNAHLVSYGESNSSWGGLLPSGLGRTHGELGLLETLQVQYVDEGYGEKPEICWYPYGERLASVLEDMLRLLSEPSLSLKAAVLPRFLPHLRFLAGRAPLARMLPGLIRYLT